MDTYFAVEEELWLARAEELAEDHAPLQLQIARARVFRQDLSAASEALAEAIRRGVETTELTHDPLLAPLCGEDPVARLMAERGERACTEQAARSDLPRDGYAEGFVASESCPFTFVGHAASKQRMILRYIGFQAEPTAAEQEEIEVRLRRATFDDGRITWSGRLARLYADVDWHLYHIGAERPYRRRAAAAFDARRYQPARPDMDNDATLVHISVDAALVEIHQNLTPVAFCARPLGSGGKKTGWHKQSLAAPTSWTPSRGCSTRRARGASRPWRASWRTTPPGQIER